MCNKTTPDAAAAALTTLMHALIDIECTAELAQGEEQKDRTQFALECIRYTATRSLNDAKNILIADCEGNDSNLLIVFYVQIMPDDLVMQLHRF